MATVNLDGKKKFIKNLPSRPYCTEHLTQGTHIRDRSDAICYPYIQMNQHRRSYIVIDVDIKNSAFLWEYFDLPEPTIICVNPESTHCHYFYELENGVLFPKSNGENNNYNRKAMILFEATCKSFTKKIGGDFAYNSFIAKNPLHPHWVTHWSCAIYSLKSLSEYVDLDWTCLKSQDADFNDIASRNCFIFNAARKMTYPIIHPGISFDEIYEFVLSTVHQLNQNLSEKLPQGELRTITNSITRYCFKNKNGIIKLKTKISLDQDEIKSRQKIAAHATNNNQKLSTKQKIENCILDLKSNNKKITVKLIADSIGMSRSHLSSKYSEHIRGLI